jgi:hypothetical protein
MPRAAVIAVLLLSVAGIGLLVAGFALCQQPAGRPEWDQQKAIELIKKVAAVEESGQPWDDIAWLTDADEAVAQARKEDRPLFVWAFVRGTRGPAAAPC